MSNRDFYQTSMVEGLDRPATAASTRQCRDLGEPSFVGVLTCGRSDVVLSPTPRPPAAAPTRPKQSPASKTFCTSSPRGNNRSDNSSFLSSAAARTLTSPVSGKSPAEIYAMDFHRNVQHVPCAREVQRTLRQRLLELEARAKFRGVGKRPHSAVAPAAARTSDGSAARKSGQSDDDSSDSDGDACRKDEVPTQGLQMSAAGATSPVPPAVRQGGPSTSRPSSARARGEKYDSVTEKRRFSTNFRIDSKWSSDAYYIPDYYKSEEFIRTISPRICSQLGSAAAAGATDNPAQNGPPSLPRALTLRSGCERHAAPVFSHEDRRTARSKDAQHFGRHLAPYVVPFPIEKSLRQPDSLAELFVYEQQEGYRAREMTFSGLRADAPASVVRALISPHQEAKDAYDFAEQDEQYFKSIKQKISSAVTASLLRK